MPTPRPSSATRAWPPGRSPGCTAWWPMCGSTVVPDAWSTTSKTRAFACSPPARTWTPPPKSTRPKRLAKVDGRSPRAILVSTFADELAIRTAGRAKIFGVSVKDRGAVTMAGHTGTAYWFSKASGEFVTSNYYMDRYPEWVAAWNAPKHPKRYAGTQWELLNDPASYQYGDADDKAWETALPGWGRVFPHPYGAADGKMFTTFLTLSPAGDELTLDFALELVDREGLGSDDGHRLPGHQLLVHRLRRAPLRTVQPRGGGQPAAAGPHPRAPARGARREGGPRAHRRRAVCGPRRSRGAGRTHRTRASRRTTSTRTSGTRRRPSPPSRNASESARS